ncbi:MAG: ATP-binding protein, partial [Anaerolineales bacterium]
MNSENFKELPDCELIKALAEKADQRHDINFNFLGKLDDFRQQVCSEVRQINELFPEYTPHDEQYHLTKLFHVADTVLGRERIEAMNPAELFVLAVALYGHDWGMAVSEQEKQYILTSELPEGTKAGDFWILPGEHDRLTQFAHEKRLTIDADGRLEQIPIEMWREYVRETHAVRSGERVRRFFESIDGGVAEAASRVCVGHWLDFEDLQDHNLYPPDFSVLRETVNLRAIAVYLRLIDLLDLGEDRTPYIIWKFVAPRDPRSKMEWAKHRALRPVTCPPYQEGHIIRVDGSTEDHEIYAALEDLRIYCEEQLRGCNDLLARMNDPRHKLDLYHIDWRVKAEGFDPISIQFEFDREQMFKILSDEIYGGDPYVFLRELLQNSIDAIRMRREVLQSKGIVPGNMGVIYVNVEHDAGGDAVITWQDNGIGMDKYIVKNYLATAGKSYYRSSDFERQGLKMDPISKFGIGILSCFLVADRIEIETFKDPYLPPAGEALKITIPAMRRQFRIETRPQEGANVGTTVNVFVDGKKIPTDEENEPAKPLDVTAYLSIVAGFVEFPIVVTEGDRKTIVLHPNQDAEAARQRFGEAFKVHQLDLGYLWAEAILPQDLLTAREMLREERWDIASDLGLEGYDGVLAYLVPRDGIDTEGGGYNGSRFVVRGKDEPVPKIVRFNDDFSYYFGKAVGMSHSSKRSPTYAVYRDGILLSTASVPKSPFSLPKIHRYLPVPRIVVNLPKTKSPRVDLARSKTRGMHEHWDSPVYRAYLHHLFEISLKNLLALNPAERLYQLGRIIAFYNIEPEGLLQVFPHERLPVPFLEVGGRSNVLEWQELTADALYMFPKSIEEYIYRLCYRKGLTNDSYNGFLIQWTGERCIIRGFGNLIYLSTSSAAIESAGEVWNLLVRKSYTFTAIRFLHPPWEGDPPLLQEIWFKTDMPNERPEIETVLERTIENP